MNRTFAGAIALILLTAPNAAAQACAHALVGRVTDESGQPVRGALVMDSGMNVHAQADSTGRYRLCRLPIGPLTLSVHYLGMTRYVAHVVVSGDRDDTLDVHLARPFLCRHASTIDTALLASAEARWKSAGLHSYAFVVTEFYYGKGSDIPWQIVVRNDTVTAAAEVAKWKANDSIPFGRTHVSRDARHFATLTPPQLFAQLHRLLTDSIHTTSVQYDETLGYPTRLSENLNCAFDAGGTIRVEYLHRRE